MSLVYTCNKCGEQVGARDRAMQRDWYELRTILLETVMVTGLAERGDLTGHYCPKCYKTLTEFLLAQEAVNQ